MKISIRDKAIDIDVITVSIVETSGNSLIMFNCPICRTPVFQCKGRLVSLLPGYIPTEIPTIHRCSNSSCKQKYLIKTILSRQVFV